MAALSTTLFCCAWKTISTGSRRVTETSFYGRRASQLGRGLDVNVTEPDISPLQLQGPLSPHVAKKLFGEIAVTMGYYHCHELELNGIPVVLTRTGWSGELGYEIYLLDGSRGTELWDLIMAAGEEHGIIPACPSLPRSVEGGILSYASDITLDDTPFTIGLERLIDVDKPSDYIGKAALQRLAKEPTPRKLVGANFGGEPVGSNDKFWDVYSADEVVGSYHPLLLLPTTRAQYCAR